MNNKPQLSVVCPVFNEEAYIRNIVDFFLQSKPANKELIIIDGGSTDKTRDIISEYSSGNPDIRLMENPKKFVPYALNMAIPYCAADIIVRLDAHTKYNTDYFESILKCFEKTGADIVGGPMRAVGITSFQEAVAIATSTSFGIGDSKFHDEAYEGYTDSVYLGSWKSGIFRTCGLFDTDMLRNQDDEFHYRAKSKGMRIYLDPKIKSWYYPRKTLKSLYRQYFQYGLFKPLVLKKVKSGMRIRHLIPPGFAIYLLLLIPISYFFPEFLVPLILYLLLDFYFSFRHGKKLSVILNMLIIYPALHLSYGMGFIKGQVTLMFGKKPSL